jgi:acetyl esterase/lipase
MAEADWRKRFLAPRLTLPNWARDNPERLLYSTNASGKWELVAWDRRTDSHRQVTDRPEGTTMGAIDPTGEWIWWWDDTRGNELGRWMVEPFDGSAAPRPAAPDLPAAYNAGLALGHGLAVIGISEPGRGAAIHLVRDGEAPRLLYAHRQAANVARLSRDETLLCFSHSEESDSMHRALRVIDLEGERVGELFDGRDRDLQFAGFSRVAGDQRLIVVHQRTDQRRPMVWDPVAGTESELGLELPGEVSATWYPDGGALLIIHEHRGRTELYRYDLDSGALAPLPGQPGSILGAGVRPDGEVWHVWNNSATPPEVRSGERVLLRPPGEPSPAGVPYSLHEVDGVSIFLAEPPGDRPHPTIFQIHGGPTAHDSDSFSPVVQAWVDHGYAVVLVNYRGSTGYGRVWRDALIGNPGLTELEDIAKVHDWVVGQGIADLDRVILAGGSWGGYLTLLGLGTQPERWSLGISGVPIADWLSQYEDVMEPLKAYDRALFGGSPDEIPDVYRRCSPATYVDNVRVPVLILAGENDPRCPIRQVNSYVDLLEKLEKAHEVYRYDAGHGSMVTEETIKQMEMRLAFAARHLGTPAPA